MEFPDLGRLIITFGIVLVLVGVVVTFASKLPGIARLPGDIYVERDGFSFYFPLATSIILSIVLTIIFTFFGKR